MPHLVTGYAGEPHVKSEDTGGFNAGVVGTGKYVLKTLDKMQHELINSNTIRIKTGDLVNQGRHIRVEEPETLTLDNGEAGRRRIDLIVMRYTKDQETAVESAELVVIKGQSVANTQTPSVPAVISGNILAGAAVDDFVLYKIVYDGLNMKTTRECKELLPLANTPTVRYGTAAPDNSVGVDGDIYFKLI